MIYKSEKNNVVIDLPVLLVVFNRVDTTMRVLDAIAGARPPRLYVASDGPRALHNDDNNKVLAVREYILNNIDWDCKVTTLFRDKNLGCEKAVSGAITWFFEHEKMGIILEDDCLPDKCFFSFCEELLNKYYDDTRVFGICGSNLLSVKSQDYSYFFSKYIFVWGWATWRRAWAHYKVKSGEKVCELSKEYYGSFYFNDSERNAVNNIINRIKSGNLNTWDYPFYFSALLQHGLFVIPKCNMVSNIGSGLDATHNTRKGKHHELPTYQVDVPLIHPEYILPNYQIDVCLQKKLFAKCNVFKKIINIIHCFLEHNLIKRHAR